MKIQVIVSGRSYPTFAEIPARLELPDGATVAAALESLAERMPAGSALPPSCLLAVSGTHLGTLADHRARTLADGDELVVIAPVAGG
jgi:molybdopterin converting factor small subunit